MEFGESVMQVNKQVQRDQETGSLEAGISLIPITFLLLGALQIFLAGGWQENQTAKLQDTVNRLFIERPDASPSDIRAVVPDAEIVVDHGIGGRIIAISRHIPIPILSSLVGEKAGIRAIAIVHAR